MSRRRHFSEKFGIIFEPYPREKRRIIVTLQQPLAAHKRSEQLLVHVLRIQPPLSSLAIGLFQNQAVLVDTVGVLNERRSYWN
jgi:hypothetical protein